MGNSMREVQATGSQIPIYDTAVRGQAVNMLLAGHRQGSVAHHFGVTRQTIRVWALAHREGTLETRRRKRRVAYLRERLTPYEEQEIVRTLLRGSPRHCDLPFSLWTCKAILQVIRAKCGKRLSVWRLKLYLEQWGFASQKSVRRGFLLQPAAVTRWLAQQTAAASQHGGQGTVSGADRAGGLTLQG